MYVQLSTITYYLGKGAMMMEEVSVNSQEKEIDLRVLFDILRKNLILMIVVFGLVLQMALRKEPSIIL